VATLAALPDGESTEQEFRTSTILTDDLQVQV
jgi:hypothetical protein